MVPLAHAATGDPADTISDFTFAPATLTVHVGDTVTWTNNGPSPHTATADNGSFDTGTLNKGASGSHTFASAGTFAYICKIHPFMHGTIVVLASSSSTTPATGASGSTGSSSGTGSFTGSSSTSSSSPSSASSSGTLPVTGSDLGAIALVGLGLLAIGFAVRRRA